MIVCHFLCIDNFFSERTAFAAWKSDETPKTGLFEAKTYRKITNQMIDAYEYESIIMYLPSSPAVRISNWSGRNWKKHNIDDMKRFLPHSWATCYMLIHVVSCETWSLFLGQWDRNSVRTFILAKKEKRSQSLLWLSSSRTEFRVKTTGCWDLQVCLHCPTPWRRHWRKSRGQCPKTFYDAMGQEQ